MSLFYLSQSKELGLRNIKLSSYALDFLKYFIANLSHLGKIEISIGPHRYFKKKYSSNLYIERYVKIFLFIKLICFRLNSNTHNTKTIFLQSYLIHYKKI